MLARKKLCVALGCVAVLLAAAVLALSLNACGTRDALFKSPEATWRSASTSLLAPKGPFATALALVDKSMASASLQVKERLEQLEAEKAEAERVAAEGEALIEGENNDEGESGEGGGSGSGSGGTSGGSGSGSSGGGSGGSSGGSGGSSGGGGTVQPPLGPSRHWVPVHVDMYQCNQCEALFHTYDAINAHIQASTNAWLANPDPNVISCGGYTWWQEDQGYWVEN